MNPVHTKKLSATQKQDILLLTSACKEAEELSLSAPLEDELDYFLLYDKQQLVSMLFLFFPEQTTCECGAFTLPSHRKKGLFSILLDQALDFVEALEMGHGSSIDFCFLADEKVTSCMAVLHALEAQYWYSEYGMKRPLDSSDRNYRPVLTIHKAEGYIFTASLDHTIIGTCITLPHGETMYIYGFEIQEALRGQGYGCDFLLGMFAILSHQYSSISLQVSGQNMAALHLYKKTGFLITETLSYYLY